MSGMSKSDRADLAKLASLRVRQAEREAETREKVILADILELATAEFDRQDELWAEATRVADEATVRANKVIAEQCAELGIPAQYAPRLTSQWSPRSPDFARRSRREELEKLARARASALTKIAKTNAQDWLLKAQESLILDGLETDAARRIIEAMPTVAELMPPLSLDDLGVKRWQPADDAAAQLLTPPTPADRRRKKILRAIEINPGKSDRAIAQIAGCDHKTVAVYRRGELPAILGKSPTFGGEVPGQSPDPDDDDA